jgi:hypothetical protein
MHTILIAVLLAVPATDAVPSKVEPGSRDDRLREIEEYLTRTEELVRVTPGGTSHRSRVRPFDWFATEPAGSVGAEMIPVILQRILPDLAQELGDRDPEDPAGPLFGRPEDELARFGFWRDPRPEHKDRPLPLGFAWTPGRAGDALPLSLAVRTCAGCHTGRVRREDGSLQILVGAPNTELLLHQYDAAIGAFFAKHLADEAQNKVLVDAIVRTVDAKHKADPNFFFRKAPGYAAPEEARQIAVFKALLEQPLEKGGVLASIGLASTLRGAGRAKLKEVAYAKPNAPPLEGGPPGLIDSSGLGIAAFVLPLKLDPKRALFPGATKNDIPSVWNQRTRKRFQWDANIRDELARNLVAALGLVGVPERMDILANMITSDFIDGLPPAPYPFAIDAAKAARGRAIFEANCSACHRADQERRGHRAPPVFNHLGTDGNRSRVVRPLGYVAIEGALAACYQPRDLEFTYRGRSYRPNAAVDGNALLVPRFAAEDQGYVAPPLDGLWARAPYLHNGSVPTLRQLLVPKTRVATFVRGVISYDRKDVGWDWQAARLAEWRTTNPSARTYETAHDGQSATGHDQVQWVDADGIVGAAGKTFRLAWDDPNDPEVDALLEYLKSL